MSHNVVILLICVAMCLAMSVGCWVTSSAMPLWGLLLGMAVACEIE